MKLNKDLGQVFTPHWVVEKMLDNVEYRGSSVLDKKILEPSAGDGVFVCEAVKRLIQESLKENLTTEETRKKLAENIYAFEIDTILFEKLIENTSNVANEYGIENVAWNFHNVNSLHIYTEFKEKFDYIIGNPPYIRVHSISQEDREYIRSKFQLCKEGTMDIYFIFFEIAEYMCKKGGVISYITPNTFMRTKIGEVLRTWMLDSKNLKSIIDFKGLQVFNESTFTSICTLEKGAELDSFSVFDGENNFERLEDISYAEARTRAWDFYSKEENQFIKNQLNGSHKVSDYYDVQCAICTLRDKLYIQKVENWDLNEETVLFNGFEVEKGILHPVEKGTKYNGNRTNLYMLFPYHMDGEDYKPFEENFFMEKYPLAYHYLNHHKEDLLKRDMDSAQHWYIFGRSQGIRNSKKVKLVFKSIVRNHIENLDVHVVPEDTFIYSGIYITGENIMALKEILESVDFAKYLSLRGLNKAGGYKEINTKMIKNFCIDKYIKEE